MAPPDTSPPEHVEPDPVEPSDADAGDIEPDDSASGDVEPDVAPRRKRHLRRIIALVLVGSAVLGLVADLSFTAGKVHPRITAGGVEVGGETLSKAKEVIGAEETRLQGDEIRFHAGEQVLATTPLALGWKPDASATADAAFAVGRHGPLSWISGRLGAWLFGRQIGWVATWDRRMMHSVTSGWAEVVGQPIQEGSVQIDRGEVVATDPKPGTRIDNDALVMAVERALISGDRDMDLPVTQAAPVSTAQAVATAKAQAESVIAGPIRIGVGKATISLSTLELGDLFTTSVDHDATTVAQPVAGFDPSKVDRLLEPYKASVETPAVDATITGLGRSDIQITPSQTGRELDADVAAGALFRIATSASRTGNVPLVTAEPDVTTEDVKALNITTRLSTFTTYYTSGEARVINIQRGADVLDGAIIQPGDTFSINERLGERTYDKGYVDAPAIWDGVIVEQVGGGISQLTTTLYNAAFFAGFPIDEHQAHSVWFTRYPMGREATLGWLHPDLKFTNDLETPVVVHASYTDTSITVSVYGTEKTRNVTATQPKITEKDKDFYTVAVTREITDLAGKVLDREVFLTRYHTELAPTPTPTPPGHSSG